MTNANDDVASDLGSDLQITKTTRRASGIETWVSGELHGYRFEALVFPKHAENPEWELGDSRISKLWIARSKTKRRSSTGTAGWTCRPPRLRRRRWSISCAPVWLT